MAISRKVLLFAVSGWIAWAPLSALNPNQRAAVTALQQEARADADTKLRVHSPSLATQVLKGQAMIPGTILGSVWPLAKPGPEPAPPPPWAGSALPRILARLDKADGATFAGGMARYLRYLSPYILTASLAPGDAGAVALDLSRTLGGSEASWGEAMPFAVKACQALVVQADKDLIACLSLWMAGRNRSPESFRSMMGKLLGELSRTPDVRMRISLFERAFSGLA